MADNMGPRSNGSGYYPPSSQQMPPWELMQQWQQFQQWQQQQQQQQPGGAQMGTRGFQGGIQGQQPGGFQGQVEPQQGFGMTQPSDITPQEKVVLRGVLDILKQVRVALTRGVDDETDEMMDLRQTAAKAYLAGFLEAKGQQEVGSYISTIPPLSTRGIVDDGGYDQMLDDLDLLLHPETRGAWGSLAKAGLKVARKVNWGGVARDVAVNIGSSAIWEAVPKPWKR